MLKTAPPAGAWRPGSVVAAELGEEQPPLALVQFGPDGTFVNGQPAWVDGQLEVYGPIGSNEDTDGVFLATFGTKVGIPFRDFPEGEEEMLSMPARSLNSRTSPQRR